jgi:hypothetical protein
LRRPTTIIVLCAALTACVPALATASSPSSSSAAVIADCQAHNKLTGSYTLQALKHALATLPADVAEYTDCHDVIQSQILAEAHGNTSGDAGSGSGSSFLPTPVIVIIVVLALAGITFIALEVRRRRGGQQ